MSFHHLDDLDIRTIVPGFHGKFIHGDNVTVAVWQVDAGASLPEHAHHHEQITMIVDGTFEMTVGGETRRLGAGDIVVIPGHVTHAGKAITDCRITDVFQPARDDYR